MIIVCLLKISSFKIYTVFQLAAMSALVCSDFDLITNSKLNWYDSVKQLKAVVLSMCSVETQAFGEPVSKIWQPFGDVALNSFLITNFILFPCLKNRHKLPWRNLWVSSSEGTIFRLDMVSVICSDGASTMLRRNSGFRALVKVSAKHIIVSHCVLRWQQKPCLKISCWQNC